MANKPYSKTDAVSVWNGETDAEKGVRGGINERKLFCKKCDRMTKVRVSKSDKTTHEGHTLLDNVCTECGNTWVFRVNPHKAGDNRQKSHRGTPTTTIGDVFNESIRIKGMNSNTRNAIKYAHKCGLLDDKTIDVLGHEQDIMGKSEISDIIRSQGEMITTMQHPQFDDKTNYTIKCVRCGRESVSFSFIRDFQCPDCSGRRYTYLMLNGKHI